MTKFATHRFSVGQRVTRSAGTPTPWVVVAHITGPRGPKYRIRRGTSETVALERELAYTRAFGALARDPNG
jgi:hypothetical protein